MKRVLLPLLAACAGPTQPPDEAVSWELSPLFEVEVYDSDGVWDDWLMEPEQRATSSATGQTTLDFVKSKLTVDVKLP